LSGDSDITDEELMTILLEDFEWYFCLAKNHYFFIK